MTAEHPPIQWRPIKHPERWRPAKGDTVAGIYTGTTVLQGTYGEYTAILLGVPRAGTPYIVDTILVGMAQVVQALAVNDVPVGALVRLTYKGKSGPPGRKKHAVEVQVSDDSVALLWEAQ